MASALFSCAPFIACGLGFFCALAAARSAKQFSLLMGAVLLAQMVVWSSLFVAAEVSQNGWTVAWQGALAAGFLWSLLIVFCYTTIGAVAGAGLVLLMHKVGSRKRSP